MGTIERLRVAWTGGSGGDGVSTFYAEDASTAAVSAYDFFNSVKSGIPDEITLTVEPFGEQLDDATGDLVGGWSTTPPAIINGTFTGSYASSSGLVMNWLTGDIVNSHRVRGKTYLVPLNPGNFNGLGMVEPSAITLLNGYGQTLIDDNVNNFKVWHRPVARVGGASFNILTAKLSPKPAVLRSRRD